MDKFFKISARGSTVPTEIIGGLTTFLAMSYIIAVNPAMMQAAGMPFNAALTATCVGAAIMTIAMGVFANRPIALASGMGINAVVAYSLCLGLGVDWRVAMGVIFLEGIVILLLVLCGLRKAVMDAIPVALRRAIGIGIGLFIAFIGLKGGGFIAADESTLIALGDLTSPAAIVAAISIVIAVVLTALNFKGGLLISIVAATIVGIPLGVTPAITDFSFAPDFSAFAAPFQMTPDGALAIAEVLVQPVLLLFVFSLLMSDFFDTMGTVVAVGSRADFVDEKGDVEDVQPILIVDSAAAAFGGFVGASSITSFVESVSGAAAGARTGLSNIVIGIAFIVCAFLAPVIGMVTSSATCGALVVVGYLMMTEIGAIDWSDITSAFPAFMTIAGIPMTYSIANGIGLGFISYCIIKAVKGEARDVKPLMWVASLAFLASFIFS
ncbi:NCS2 family permease [Eggerthella sinensis]|uniref:NCS2 family permease n=1 Tax=Eggerthella sinensis TaxID=242230 RepID=A0A3N0J1H4_9ACTN|nr:NCS2 family permease [Eggerthella sinensis]MCB7038430.1 NCS2 family permease [Eggerthella sinensis]RDB69077.1 NCS2 family permease [Eggerthella sinensis]RNM43098.1 NCS2 family permease [Eggerthella sinensis]